MEVIVDLKLFSILLCISELTSIEISVLGKIETSNNVINKYLLEATSEVARVETNRIPMNTNPSFLLFLPLFILLNKKAPTIVANCISIYTIFKDVSFIPFMTDMGCQ